jgi:membrane dipeptidase
MLIFDAHLDLAMNALEWNRDLRESIEHICARDGHYDDKPDRGKGTVSFPEMRRGQVRL